MYPQKFSAADQVDMTFFFILGISIVVLILITLTMLFFLYKYHRTRHPVAADIEGNVVVEIIWTIVPAIIFAAMFYYGWTSYKSLRTVPQDAIEINVKSRMWSWRFEYPNGKASSELFVPLNQAVKLNLTSSDVIHSFYVPAFRIKVDAVPGMDTYTWLKSDKTGTFDIYCAEYCGLKHADMITTVTIMEENEFAQWYEGGDAKIAGANAKPVFEKHGCLDCHTLNGEELVGPSFKDIFERKTLIVENDKEMEIIADRAYLKESILNPEAKIVKDFDPMMPPYEGELPEADLNIMLDYYEKGNAKPKLNGREILETEGCMDCHSTDGEIIAGPSFKDIINRKTAVIEDGEEKEVYANKSYIIESIMDPEKKMVKDYDPMMPPYEYLTSDQISAIVEYFESISEESLKKK